MAKSSASTSHNKQPAKSNKWKRRLKWIAFLTLLAFLINGPIARWGVKRSLNKALENQGMSGDSEISGSLHKGFTISDLSYSGGLGIQSLKIKSATIEYSIIELFDSKIKSISLTGMRAEIDVAKFPPSDAATAGTTWQSQLDSIRPWLTSPHIAAHDLEINVVNNSSPMLHWELASLLHDSESNTFTLQDWKVQDASGNATPKQVSTITWDQEEAQLDHLALLTNITLDDLLISWDSSAPSPKGKATLSLFGSQCHLNIDDKITITRNSGEIDSRKIAQQFNLQLPAQLILSDYQISISNYLDTPPAQWKIDSKFKIKEGQMQEYSLRDAQLSFQQDKLVYRARIDANALGSDIRINLSGSWTQPNVERWWLSTRFTLNLTTDSLKLAALHINGLPSSISLSSASVQSEIIANLREGTLPSIEYSASISHLSSATQAIPNIKISGHFTPKNRLTAAIEIQHPNSQKNAITANLDYQFDTENYIASLHVNENDHSWINALLHDYNQPFSLENTTILSWNGSGNHDSHTGKLIVGSLALHSANKPAIHLQTTANYQWPEQLNIESFLAKQDELTAAASLLWDGSTITLPKLSLSHNDLTLASISGTVPYSTSITTAEAFFQQPQAWKCSLHTDKISLARLTKLLPSSILSSLQGTLQTDLEIGGSPLKPTVTGDIKLLSVKGIADHELEPLNLKLNLTSKQQKLHLLASLAEGNTPRLSSDITLPFTPHLWMKQHNLIDYLQKTADISGTANINKLPLSRFKSLLPQLEKIKGTFTADAHFSGSINQPKYALNFHASLPLIVLKNKDIGDIRELHLKGTFDQSQLLHAQLDANINGGKFTAKILADATKPSDPKWDIQLITDHALIHRDDALAIRMNANIRLLGTLQDSTISGNLDIVESLFYKDIELIPIGVPSSAVQPVKLPSLSPTGKNLKLPIPAPFDQWKLNLRIRTADPILLRGNLANGSINGTIKVNGTLSTPALDGTLDLVKLRAKLPFSELNVKHGTITFTPRNGFIPQLQIRGTSTIGNYQTNLYVHGSADSPKTSFSSFPPLPENEIMTLLATGTTTAGLENQDVATYKALQILLRKLSQNKQTPNGNRLFKALLKTMSEMNLKVGEVDEFTGRKFSSASYKIHRRWHLTAQMDNEQQTRGLIVYVLRFR